MKGRKRGRKENGISETFREKEGKNLVNEFRSDGKRDEGVRSTQGKPFPSKTVYIVYLAFVSSRISSIFGKRRRKNFGGHGRYLGIDRAKPENGAM